MWPARRATLWEGERAGLGVLCSVLLFLELTSYRRRVSLCAATANHISPPHNHVTVCLLKPAAGAKKPPKSPRRLDCQLTGSLYTHRRQQLYLDLRCVCECVCRKSNRAQIYRLMSQRGSRGTRTPAGSVYV